MKRFAPVALSALGSIFCAGALLAADDAGSAAFDQERAVEIDGAPRFDYVTCDADSGKVYVSHGKEVVVFKEDTGDKLGTIDGVDGSHGIAVFPDLKKGFATAGRKNQVIVFDTETYKTLGAVDTDEGPDGILAVRSAQEVWSFNGKGESITCIDVNTLKVVATIKLEAGPESSVEWADKGIVAVNIEDKSDLVTVDIKKHAVVNTYPLAPGEGPAGLSIDTKDGLVFSGCHNNKLIALDLDTGKVVKAFDIGKGNDACAFDSGTQTAFASQGDGTTAVIHVKDAATFEQSSLATAAGGRTCACDSKTHRLFVCSGPRGRNAQGKVKLLFKPHTAGSSIAGNTAKTV